SDDPCLDLESAIPLHRTFKVFSDSGVLNQSQKKAMATPQKAPPPYDRIWQRISCRTACTMAALLSASQLRRWGQGPDARRVAAGRSTRRAAERATLIYGQ